MGKCTYVKIPADQLSTFGIFTFKRIKNGSNSLPETHLRWYVLIF